MSAGAQREGRLECRHIPQVVRPQQRAQRVRPLSPERSPRLMLLGLQPRTIPAPRDRTPEHRGVREQVRLRIV